METKINFLSEDMVDNTMFENGQSDAYSTFFSESGPEGDDEDEEDEDTDQIDTASDDDPPLNADVVHSPVTTQPGGRPKD